MKNPLQTLLIVVALGLCGLCTWQWYSQSLQQKQIDTVAQQNYNQAVAIQDYTNSIANLNNQISQMDANLTKLRETVKSNNVALFGLRTENGRLTSEIGQYSNAVVQLEGQIKQANDVIVRQNDSVKTLVADRDEYVKRLNDSIKDRNAIVAKYNDLVKQVEAMQAQAKAPPKQ
jgi:chromosome segregation ATPase